MLQSLPEVGPDGVSEVTFRMVCGQPAYTAPKVKSFQDQGYVLLDSKACANGFGDRNHVKNDLK